METSQFWKSTKISLKGFGALMVSQMYRYRTISKCFLMETFFFAFTHHIICILYIYIHLCTVYRNKHTHICVSCFSRAKPGWCWLVACAPAENGSVWTSAQQLGQKNSAKKRKCFSTGHRWSADLLEQRSGRRRLGAVGGDAGAI